MSGLQLRLSPTPPPFLLAFRTTDPAALQRLAMSADCPATAMLVLFDEIEDVDQPMTDLAAAYILAKN